MSTETERLAALARGGVMNLVYHCRALEGRIARQTALIQSMRQDGWEEQEELRRGIGDLPDWIATQLQERLPGYEMIGVRVQARRAYLPDVDGASFRLDVWVLASPDATRREASGWIEEREGSVHGDWESRLPALIDLLVAQLEQPQPGEAVPAPSGALVEDAGSDPRVRYVPDVPDPEVPQTFRAQAEAVIDAVAQGQEPNRRTWRQEALRAYLKASGHTIAGAAGRIGMDRQVLADIYDGRDVVLGAAAAAQLAKETGIGTTREWLHGTGPAR